MENRKSVSKKLKTSHGNPTEKSTFSLETCGDDNSLDFLNLSPGDCHAAQKVFGIHLTLTKILNFLPAKNLLPLRPVNKLWNEQITKLITNNRDIKIHLYFNSSLKNFQVGFNENEHENGAGKTLAKLNEHLENSGQLFCHNFLIEGHRLENPEMVKFLSLYGKQIKMLHLKWSRIMIAGRVANLRVCSLRKLLIDQCPNLEHLELNGDLNNFELFPQENQETLPNLKSFSFSPYFDQVDEIILASPNLTSLNDNVFFSASLDFFDTNVDNPCKSKSHLMKTLRLTEKEPGLSSFLEFAETEPKLTVLDLSDPAGFKISRQRMRDNHQRYERDLELFHTAMTKLLFSCKNSLTHIDTGFHHTYFNTQVKWPRMENVKSLTVGPVLESCIQLPQNFVSQCFPNVEKMKLDFVPYLDKFWLPESFLNSNPGLLKLKELQVKLNMTPEKLDLLEKLNSLAPNLEVLSVTDIPDFSLHSKWIWGFKKLRQLNLELRIDSDSPIKTFSSLLMNFTGLDEESCLDILNLNGTLNSNDSEGIKKIDVQSENPSLFDCKVLESLNIEFACNCKKNSKSSEALRLMAHVLIDIGLKRMTNNLIINYSFKYLKK